VLALLAGWGVKVAQIKSLIAYGHAAVAAGPPPEWWGPGRRCRRPGRTGFLGGHHRPARGVTVSNDAAGVVSAIKFQSGRRCATGKCWSNSTAAWNVRSWSLCTPSSLWRASPPNGRVHCSRTTPCQKRSSTVRERDAIRDRQRSSLAGADRSQDRARPVRRAAGHPTHQPGPILEPRDWITDLQSTDANFVDFTLPQQQLKQIAVAWWCESMKASRSARRGDHRRH